MVMGAAQYNGVPSPDLAARLNEALKLFDNKDSSLIMLTGGKEKGDVYTESEAGHPLPGGHEGARRPTSSRPGATRPTERGRGGAPAAAPGTPRRCW